MQYPGSHTPTNSHLLFTFLFFNIQYFLLNVIFSSLVLWKRYFLIKTFYNTALYIALEFTLFYTHILYYTHTADIQLNLSTELHITLLIKIVSYTDETFLVRDCSTKSSAEPYVLVIYYGNKVYNIKIRFLEESQQYALGTGLRGNDKFDSVQEIIDFYKYVPITLIDGKDKSGMQREQCYLTHHFKFNRRCVLP
uniref:SH2 domain-containing protein n=1 Tax=Pelusios castaneus TaxID=367368 RepID=A0A8C8S1R1_9SAUR